MFFETQSIFLHPGIIAAVVFLLGAAVIAILPRYHWLAAAILLVIVTPLATLGVWFSTGELGISDWDYYFSYHHNIRRTVLEFHQLPLWNPWTCGGTAALADPEFPLFTPTFLLELIFGIPAGFRLAIYLSLTLTAIGMLLLAKRLGFSVWAALLTALAVTFGSVNLLEIVEGHPNIFSVMWLPWVFWSWLGAYRHDSQLSHKITVKTNDHHNLKIDNWKLIAAPFRSLWRRRENWKLKIENYHWLIITVLFLSLMFFQGGVYLLTYTAAAFLVLTFLVKHPLLALKTSFLSGLFALGLSAVKLIPVLLWLRQFPDTAYASSAFTLPYLHQIFLGRYLHRAGEIIPNQGSGWHEYGAYLGPIILILALFGLFLIKRRLVKALLISAILAILLSSSGPILKTFFDQIPYIPRSNISRTILFAVVPLALLAGLGLDLLLKLLSLTKKPPIFASGSKALVAVIILFLVAVDLFTLSSALSFQPFVLPDVVPAVSPAPYPIAYTAFNYETRHNGDDFTRSYAAARAGYGTLSYCSVLTPPIAIRTIHDELDNGLISLTNSAANYQLQAWTPNQVKITVTSPAETQVILNTNYAKGWLINGQPAHEITNRVGTTVSLGTHALVFSYRPPGLLIGLIISTISILTTLVVILFSKKNKPRNEV